MQHDFILLDRSGSMAEHGKWAESLNAVNGYVKKLAEDNVDTCVTLAVFDLDGNRYAFDVIRDRITPKTWKPVSDADAVPRGLTPLLDSIGRLVSLANAGINGEQYDKVAIIIVTDGLENASKEVSKAAAKDLLDGCRAKGWQVIMLGADFDNIQQAAGLGVSKGATMDCVAPEKMGLAAASLAGSRGVYGATGQAMEFTEEEKARLRR